MYGIEHIESSVPIYQITEWDGQKAFDLMSLSLPKEGEVESAQQKKAKEIFEACLQRSFGFKLAHGFTSRVFGETLGSLWRKHVGSDDVPETYALVEAWDHVLESGRDSAYSGVQGHRAVSEEGTVTTAHSSKRQKVDRDD
jgi:hypothetical protein